MMKSCPVCRHRIPMRRLWTADYFKGIACDSCRSVLKYSKWYLGLFPVSYLIARVAMDGVRFDSDPGYLALFAILLAAIYGAGLSLVPLKAFPEERA